MRHVKSLDGIRGVAVLMVMLFHYGYFGAGWVGVQVFFTLSGFLITSILLQDRSSAFLTYVGRFYWRRALRIFPLFLVFLLAVASLYLTLGVPHSFALDWPWLVTYAANFARMRQADLGPCFVHIWSLAVEEQFYMLWPLLLFFLPLQHFRRVVLGLLIVTPLIRFALFQTILKTGHDASYAGKAAYVLPFTQFDAFAAGAAIPLWGLERLRNAGRWLTAALGIAAIAGLAKLTYDHLYGGGAYFSSLGYPMFLTQHFEYVWGYSLLNAISALAIICTLQRWGITRLMENAFLVRVGKVSYGVYVYHVPLLVLATALVERQVRDVGTVLRFVFFVLWVVVVLGVSEVSFRWLESPFLKLKDYWNKSVVAGRVREHAA